MELLRRDGELCRQREHREERDRECRELRQAARHFDRRGAEAREQSLPGKPDAPEKEPIERLHDIAVQVEKFKDAHKTSLLNEARQAMDRLAADNPATASYVASKYVEP